MMAPAIQFKNVSKKFILKHQRSKSFQEIFVNFLRITKNKEPDDLLSVLDDVSFTIEKGESVAFIGPNGTGKSTTLKLISGILNPDAGTMIVDGRVGALLELGAGFHPDLTGRENIYLNGAVLGMSQAQVRQRMDAIVNFSELERFIDIPVKHYSSGMFMRLGFSIAVHTDPEILLVDEVLAVGDASFQRKCLDMIDVLKTQGVTVILVSHNLGDVQKICSRAIWMEKGKIISDGITEEVTKKYLQSSLKNTSTELITGLGHRAGSGLVKIETVRFLTKNNQETKTFQTGDMLIIEIQYNILEQVPSLVFGVGVHKSDGTHITGPNTKFAGYKIPIVMGEGIIQYVIPDVCLLEGTYYISLSVSNDLFTEMFDYHEQMYSIEVVSNNLEKYGLVSLRGYWMQKVTV